VLRMLDNLLALVLVTLMASSVFFVGISPTIDFVVNVVVFICLVVAYFYFGGR
jgi:1,4-dihydroxy-2-naphthoate octaprenyltransferase